MGKTWKRVEGVVRDRFDGVRSGATGTNSPDVVTSHLAIEVKHRKKLPQWLKDAMGQAKRNAGPSQLPMAILHEHYGRFDDCLVVMTLQDYQDWYGDPGKGHE